MITLQDLLDNLLVKTIKPLNGIPEGAVIRVNSITNGTIFGKIFSLPNNSEISKTDRIRLAKRGISFLMNTVVLHPPEHKGSPLERYLDVHIKSISNKVEINYKDNKIYVSPGLTTLLDLQEKDRIKLISSSKSLYICKDYNSGEQSVPVEIHDNGVVSLSEKDSEYFLLTLKDYFGVNSSDTKYNIFKVPIPIGIDTLSYINGHRIEIIRDYEKLTKKYMISSDFERVLNETRTNTTVFEVSNPHPTDTLNSQA